ncbi:MAG TPA: DNA-directed RNA polymerase subunit omega [Candidatus Onthoplasma faecipullorum]|nr:DNA-directed RNA polymerase subunit omega [Candidatus Onthoplasma faecipullorum]
MLFEPPIDLLTNLIGNRYAVAVVVGARAKDLINKIPTMLNGSSNMAIEYAANEVARGEVIGVSSK